MSIELNPQEREAATHSLKQLVRALTQRSRKRPRMRMVHEAGPRSGPTVQLREDGV